MLKKVNSRLAKTGLCSAILLSALVNSSVFAEAAKMSGKTLHDNSCMKCHKTEVYTRKDRKIKTLAALKQRVQQCAANTKAGWNEKQIDEVIEYVNSTFYKFSVFE